MTKYMVLYRGIKPLWTWYATEEDHEPALVKVERLMRDGWDVWVAPIDDDDPAHPCASVLSDGKPNPDHPRWKGTVFPQED